VTATDDRIKRICKKYGLTEEQWHRLLLACRSHCPLCVKPFSSTRLPCVDHDHVSGLVRGLVCTACNYELGTHHDNAEWFSRCADYLNHPPSLHEGIVVYVPGSIGEFRARAV
jgi:hypothetical protein